MIGRAAVVLAVALLAACGGDGSETSIPTRPVEVPLELAPTVLGELSIDEDQSSTDAFADAGDDALITDGRLWAIRKGDTLVATLQISTVTPDVDLADAADRDAIARSILPGASETIDVAGVPVLGVTANDKTVYVWFASNLFEVLQVKTTDLDPETILTEIIRYQTERDSWVPIPADELDQEDEVIE